MRKPQNISLGYLENCNKTTVEHLSAETLEKLMKSEKVRNIMAQIEASDDEKKQGELKRQLPCAMFQCTFSEEGCQRPKADDAVKSGFAMHDWDHMPVDPHSFYTERIQGHEEEMGIVLVHVTPRGKGLRIVSILKAGEEIVQAQQSLAKHFGMEEFADRSIKDLCRLSFLPSDEYLLYINKVGLFEKPLEAETKEEAETKVEAETKGEAETKVNPPMLPSIPGGNIAESFMYEGVKYSSIIEALIKRIATDGTVSEGERNDDLYNVVRELRHICEYEFSKVYMLVLPYFASLPDNEIRRTVSSAIGTNGRTITPMLRGVISELKNQNVDEEEGAEMAKLPRLPKLSAVEEMILSKYPKDRRTQVFMASLPLWGTYGTHIRFDYLDGRENSLSFMTAVVGKSGSGKGFAADLYTKMTARFQLEDAEEREKADKYLAIINKAADDAEKPDDPRPRVRLYGDDITTNQLLEYLDNLHGEHGLQFTEEVARLQKAKRTVYGDNDDIYCKAFDNGIGGKESKSKLTRNIRIPIFLNTLFCGTPGAMHKFYNNPEGGLNNRVIFAFMPTAHMKGFPLYGKLTEQDQMLLDQTFERLWKAGQDGRKISLPWLEKIIYGIKSKWDKEDEENPNEVWYDLGKRAMVMAYRIGVLQWFLRECPEDEKSLKEIAKVVKWSAEAIRLGVYAFSGKDYEEIEEANNILQKQSMSRTSKNKKLFSLLKDDFCVQDVINLRLKNGDNDKVYTVLSRWMADGLIRSTAKGFYHKVKTGAA